MNELSDPITCAGCNESFMLTSRKIGFYAEMMSKDSKWGPPKRCRSCRDKRKREKELRANQEPRYNP